MRRRGVARRGGSSFRIAQLRRARRARRPVAATQLTAASLCRLTMVESVKWVDKVIPSVPYEVSEVFMRLLFDEHKVDFILHGDDPCLLPVRPPRRRWRRGAFQRGAEATRALSASSHRTGPTRMQPSRRLAALRCACPQTALPVACTAR